MPRERNRTVRRDASNKSAGQAGAHLSSLACEGECRLASAGRRIGPGTPCRAGPDARALRPAFLAPSTPPPCGLFDRTSSPVRNHCFVRNDQTKSCRLTGVVHSHGPAPFATAPRRARKRAVERLVTAAAAP